MHQEPSSLSVRRVRSFAMAARREAVASYLIEHHRIDISWHITLNNHASTRSRAHGLPLVGAVTRCKTYTHVAPGSANAAWRCALHLPHSFKHNDGIHLHTEGYGNTRNAASEDACRQAIIHLLIENPLQVVLQAKHWNVSPQALVAGLPGTETAHQALPVRVPTHSREAGVEARTMTDAEVDDRVAYIIRRCLHEHGGEFDPSKILSRAMGQEASDERVCFQLGKLLLPGGLRSFVQHHPEFSWISHGQKGTGMLVTWAPPGPPSGPPPAYFDAPPAPPHDDALETSLADSNAHGLFSIRKLKRMLHSQSRAVLAPLPGPPQG